MLVGIDGPWRSGSGSSGSGINAAPAVGEAMAIAAATSAGVIRPGFGRQHIGLGLLMALPGLPARLAPAREAGII